MLPAVHQTVTASPRLHATDRLWACALLALALSTGCVSETVKQTSNAPKVNLSSFGSQSLAGDLFVEQNSKSYKIKSDITIIGDNAVRLDLTTTLDLPLASIVLTNSQIQYALYRDKKFYTGRPNPHALDPIFPLSIDVVSLVAILREQIPPKAQCQQEGGHLSHCEGNAGNVGYQIDWLKRPMSGALAGRASKVVLNIPDRHVSLKFYFNDWQKSVPNAERLLSLQVPSGFRLNTVPY